MRRLLLVLVLPAALLVGVAYLGVAGVLENLVAERVQERLDLAREPDVELRSDPSWEMLLGKFSGARVTARDLDLGNVRAESATIVVEEPFAVDVFQSLRKGALVPRGSPPGRLRVELSESEVSRLVRENAGFPVNGLSLEKQGLTVESEASVLGLSIPVTVEGTVGVSGESFVFEPRRAEAAGASLPDPLVRELLAGGFRYPVDDLPYDATITDARSADGALVIGGRVPRVDLDALPPG